MRLLLAWKLAARSIYCPCLRDQSRPARPIGPCPEMDQRIATPSGWYRSGSLCVMQQPPEAPKGHRGFVRIPRYGCSASPGRLKQRCRFHLPVAWPSCGAWQAKGCFGHLQGFAPASCGQTSQYPSWNHRSFPRLEARFPFLRFWRRSAVVQRGDDPTDRGGHARLPQLLVVQEDSCEVIVTPYRARVNARSKQKDTNCLLCVFAFFPPSSRRLFRNRFSFRRAQLLRPSLTALEPPQSPQSDSGGVLARIGLGWRWAGRSLWLLARGFLKHPERRLIGILTFA